MLFANKTGSLLTPSKSKTPQKSSTNMPITPKISIKKQGTKTENIKQKMNKDTTQYKYKTKQSYQILQILEQIYSDLNFNQYDTFPLDSINNAKKNVQNLITFLGQQPTCRYHKDLLNLYCQQDKCMVCVSCVYKTGEHKNHKIKSLESVEKMIDLQTIRNDEKTRGFAHQLWQLKQEIEYMTRQIGQNYMMISKFTISVIDESIKQLNAMKVDMQKRISVAYRRTYTVINRYSEALDLLANHLQQNIQKTNLMNPLSKYLLLRELTFENDIIQSLVTKFNENKILMQQWAKSNQDFQKLILKKTNSINTRVDTYVVTQF